MHAVKAFVMISVLVIVSFITIRNAKAMEGEAKVYIINLAGVPGDWVDNTSHVADGAVDACMPRGTYIQFNMPSAHPKGNVDYPPYYEATPCVVTNWAQYKNIIESYTGIIVVNTHGQYLPVPSAILRNNGLIK